MIGKRGLPVKGGDNGLGYLLVQVRFEGKQRCFLKHRVVFFLRHGWVPDEIDHIDADRGNCHPDNLRAVTKSQNAGFKGKRTGPSSSIYKGVARSRGSKARPWRATIAGKMLGYFATQEDAARAYDAAAVAHYGPDCYRNFPDVD